MISGRINVTKIDKAKLFEGKKGKYLDFSLIETPNSKFGKDYMVVQGQTKEERERKEKSIILGDAKIFENRGGNNKPAASKGGDDDTDW
jgi:hypothetical protein